MTTPPIPEGAIAEAREEAKAYLRIAGADEDALVARLMGSAAELCEGFIGQPLIAREHEEVLRTSAAWARLSAAPVRTIAAVEALTEDGTGAPLPVDAYAVDVDAAGHGWVRVTDAGGAKRVQVRYEAGLAAEWSGLPQALRQGAVRLAAHLYTYRDAPGDSGRAPPMAVTALWRPWRAARL